MRPLDRIDKILMWKCKWLPNLTMLQWSVLAACNFAGMFTFWIGRWIGWWPYDETIAMLFVFLFVLLGITPLDFSRRMFYMVRFGDGEMRVVSWLVARQLRRSPNVQLEVHRVFVVNGEVVHGERLK